MRKIIDDKCLYVPGGAAREYASVGCNFYRGCSCQCRYCYNRTGITEHVLGTDHPVLKDCFTNTAKRPKMYRHLSGEDYAFECFLYDYQDKKKLDYLILWDELNTLVSQSKMLLELLTKKMEEKT